MKHLHSQQLVGVTKLTFQDICPEWFDKLTGKLDDVEGRLVMTDQEKCMLGEANGFSDKYVTGETPCGECFDISFGLVGVAQRYAEFPATAKELDNDPIVQTFVNHWNEFHVNI